MGQKPAYIERQLRDQGNSQEISYMLKNLMFFFLSKGLIYDNN